MNTETRSINSLSKSQELLNLKLIQNDLKNNLHFISKQPKTKTSPKLTSPRGNLNFNQLNEISREAIEEVNISPKGDKKSLFLKKIINTNNLNDDKEPLSPKLEKKQIKKPIKKETSLIKNSTELLNFTDKKLKNSLSITFKKELSLLLSNENSGVSKEFISLIEKNILKKIQTKINEKLNNIPVSALFSIPQMRGLKNEFLQENFITDLNLQNIFREKISNFIKIIPSIKAFITEHELELTASFKNNVEEDLTLCIQTFSQLNESSIQIDVILPLINLIKKPDFSKFVKKIICLSINPDIKIAKEIVSNLSFEDRFKRLEKHISHCFKEKIELEILYHSEFEWDVTDSLTKTLNEIDNSQTVRSFLTGNTCELIFKAFTINSHNIKEDIANLINQQNQNDEKITSLELKKKIFAHMIQKIIEVMNPNPASHNGIVDQEMNRLYNFEKINSPEIFTPIDILSLCGNSLWSFCSNIFRSQYPSLYDQKSIFPFHDDQAGIKCEVLIQSDNFTVTVIKRFNFLTFQERKDSASFDIRFTIKGSFQNASPKTAKINISNFDAIPEMRLKILKILTNPLPIEGVKYTILSN
ncbi:MAG: hypothetical protein Q8K60_03860 [Parachlamydiaceae bacterium]|nr:hypothetical protein [Parachlamydiaceae bacterium]